MPGPISRRLHEYLKTILRTQRTIQKLFLSTVQFTAAEKELNRHFDADVTRQFYANHQIDLTFNPAYAPHFGGVWERLIRSVKDSFYAIIGSQILTYDIFNTVFCEVEHFMNARPITTVSSTPEDVEALTPNHFLLGRAHATMPPLQTQQPSTLSRQ